MDIIVVGGGRTRSWRLRLSPVLAGLGAAACLMLGAGFTWLGWQLHAQPQPPALPTSLLDRWAAEIRGQQQELRELRARMGVDSQALSRRLAELQARVMRLDAAGGRLTQIAGLDPKEFNFEAPPPQGGPEVDLAGPSLSLEASQAQLDEFERQLGSRERRLRVIEDLLMASRLQHEIKPSGWPIEEGWISSLFGMRNDPFTGRRAFHAGIDFAGTPGSAVLAVAAGVVADAGDRYGYGLLVEINHGNGYVTRYGHNAKILVQPGERVRKGQQIALMGETGRATGPHVHFEVLRNGVVVNPEQYIEAAR